MIILLDTSAIGAHHFLELTVILSTPCSWAGEGSLQLPFVLGVRRRTAGMLRGVYPERSERAQHDSIHPGV
jgi:hypothetical protein